MVLERRKLTIVFSKEKRIVGLLLFPGKQNEQELASW